MSNRADHNAPLKGGIIDLEKWKKDLELPTQFLRFCTLKEGVHIIILYFNCVCLAVIGYTAWLLLDEPDDTTAWWKERFRDDFDFYYMDENQHIINKLYPLWIPVAYAVIVAKSIYFCTGIIVYFALCKKTANPFFYMPWLVMTGILIAVMWVMAFVMTIYLLAMLFYRPITVTWDVGPIVCVIVYNCIWSYNWFVVIAHYKRRCIVRFWKDRQNILGEAIGPY